MRLSWMLLVWFLLLLSQKSTASNATDWDYRRLESDDFGALPVPLPGDITGLRGQQSTSLGGQAPVGKRRLTADLTAVIPAYSGPAFFRIYNPLNNVDMNIAEFQLFNQGVQLTGLTGSQSTTLSNSAAFSSTALFNGNYEDFAHTSAPDANPWIAVDITGRVFDTVIIWNRNDYYGFRTVNATVGISPDAVGSSVIWSSKQLFTKNKQTYTLTVSFLIAPTPVPTAPTVLPTPIPTSNPDLSLLVDLRFEEGDVTAGTIRNYATGGSAATPEGSPVLGNASPSVFGPSNLVLNTGAKYVALPSVTIRGTAYTFAAWLQIPAATRGNAALPIANFLTGTGVSTGTIIQLTSANFLYISGEDNNANSGGTYGYSIASFVTAGSWFHMAVILGNVPSPQLFINGALVYSWTYSGVTAVTSTTRTYTNCFVGYAPWNPSVEKFYGVIDDVRLYTRQLAATEIAALAVVPFPSAVPTTAPTALPTQPTPYPFAVPTPPPSAVPTPLPSSRPTVRPTRAPTRMVPMGGPYLVQTFHSGEECASTATHYTVSLLLEKCQPPDELNSTPYKHSCRTSITGFANSVFKSTYLAGDSTCSGSLLSPPQLVSQTSACEKHPQLDAGYLRTACGDIPASLKARPQVLVKGYAQQGGVPKLKSLPGPQLCFGPSVVTRAYVLKSCMAYKQDGTRLSYYRKFSLLSLTGGSIVLQESRFLVNDNRCLQAPYITVQVTYGATTSCTADPLDSSMAYIQAYYYNGNMTSSWPAADLFIRSPLVPTASPTPRPTRPTGAPSPGPTIVPTSIPSPKPSPVPSALPSALPSAVPSPGPTKYLLTTRGLVLLLDAAQYSGTGPWVDFLGESAFTLVNGPKWSASGGGSFFFDPSRGQYGVRHTSLPTMTQWTVEAWMTYAHTETGSLPMVVTDVFPPRQRAVINYALGSPLAGSGSLNVGFLTSSAWYLAAPFNAQSAAMIPFTGWSHVVGSFNGSTLSLYVNSILRLSKSVVGGPSPVSGGGGIKLMQSWNGTACMGGSLSVVRIYNRALSPFEVDQNYRVDSLSRFSLYTAHAPTPEPSAAPTAPTLQPSAAPTSPSLQPSAAPTSPSPNPTAPSALPTPTLATTRGLVLALDAATYTTGDWIDSVGGRAFTLYNGPTWSSEVGGSIAFVAASAQYAQSPPLPSMSTWTIEVWHLWSGSYVNGYPMIVSDMFTSGNTGTINFLLGAFGNPNSIVMGWFPGWRVTPGITLTSGVWLHIVASFDGTTGNLYVNNKLAASANIAGTPSTSGPGIRLMRLEGGTTGYYDAWGGSLAKVNIYNVGLSAAEVQTNWQADLGRFGLTAAPSAVPSPPPSYLPNVPTPMPTPAPTPSHAPTRPPTPVPSPLSLTARGLVLSLDAATLSSGATAWVDSVGSRSFTLYNGPTWSSEVGGSLAFVAASSQYAQTTTALPSMSTWTIEVWHLWTGINSYSAIVSDLIGSSNSQVNFLLGASTGYSLQLAYFTSSWIGTTPISFSSGIWLHIVATFDGTTGNLYINNEQKATANMAGSPISGNTGLRLMRRWGDPGLYWSGSLGIVRIYDVGLSAAEVQTNYLVDASRFGYTTAPSAAPTAPTPAPSRAPTYLPGVPTPAPVFGVRATRGLVLALDAATYTTGNWVDSVGGKAFTLYNGPTWSSAGGGSLAFLPASAQYAQSNTALPLLTTWTIEVWTYYTGLYVGAYPCIVADVSASAAGPNFVLGTASTSYPLSTGWAGASSTWRASAPTVLTANRWAHIVSSYDGNALTVYVNGAVAVTTAATGTPTSGAAGIRLMQQWGSGSTDYMGGSLAVVKIFSVALTALEVQNSYIADRPRFRLTASPTLSPSYLPNVPTPVPSSPPSSRPSPGPSTLPSPAPSAVPADATLWLDAQATSSMTFTSGLITSWASLVGALVLRRAYPGGGGPLLSSFFNRLPGVNFANSGGGFATTQNVAISSTGDATVVFVGTLSSQASNWGALFGHGDKDTDLALEWNTNIPSTIHFQSNNDNTGVQVSFVAGAPYIYICTISGGTARTILQISALDVEQSSSATTASSISKGTSKLIYLMTSSLSDNEMARSVAAEVLYFRRVLGADEITRLKSHLKAKWFGLSSPTLAPTYLA